MFLSTLCTTVRSCAINSSTSPDHPFPYSQSECVCACTSTSDNESLFCLISKQTPCKCETIVFGDGGGGLEFHFLVTLLKL